MREITLRHLHLRLAPALPYNVCVGSSCPWFTTALTSPKIAHLSILWKKGSSEKGNVPFPGREAHLHNNRVNLHTHIHLTDPPPSPAPAAVLLVQGDRRLGITHWRHFTWSVTSIYLKTQRQPTRNPLQPRFRLIKWDGGLVVSALALRHWGPGSESNHGIGMERLIQKAYPCMPQSSFIPQIIKLIRCRSGC